MSRKTEFEAFVVDAVATYAQKAIEGRSFNISNKEDFALIVGSDALYQFMLKDYLGNMLLKREGRSTEEMKLLNEVIIKTLVLWGARNLTNIGQKNLLTAALDSGVPSVVSTLYLDVIQKK